MGRRGEMQKTVSPSPWEVKDREREAEGMGWEQNMRSWGAARIQDRQRKVWAQLRLSNLKFSCSHMYGSAPCSTSWLAAGTHEPYLKLQLLSENKGLSSYSPLICLFHKHISFSWFTFPGLRLKILLEQVLGVAGPSQRGMQGRIKLSQLQQAGSYIALPWQLMHRAKER